MKIKRGANSTIITFLRQIIQKINFLLQPMKERAAATTPRMSTPTSVRSCPRWNGRPRRGGSKWQSERKVRMTSALEIKLFDQFLLIHYRLPHSGDGQGRELPLQSCGGSGTYCTACCTIVCFLQIVLFDVELTKVYDQC